MGNRGRSRASLEDCPGPDLRFMSRDEEIDSRTNADLDLSNMRANELGFSSPLPDSCDSSVPSYWYSPSSESSP